MRIYERSLRFCSLFKQEAFSDAILFLNEERIPLHRMIVSAKSRFFRNLNWDGLEKDDLGRPIVKVTERNPSYFRTILAYLYGCTINLTSFQAIVLHYLVQQFQVEDYPRLLLNWSNAQELIEGANLAYSLGVFELVEKYIETQPIVAQGLMTIDRGEIMAKFISSDWLQVQSEFEVVDFLEQWMERVSIEEVKKVIPHLRLASMIPLDRARVEGLNQRKIYSIIEFQNIYQEALQWQASWHNQLPNKRDHLRNQIVGNLLNSDWNDRVIGIISPNRRAGSLHGALAWLDVPTDPCTGFKFYHKHKFYKAKFVPGYCLGTIGVGSLIVVSSFSKITGDVGPIVNILAFHTSDFYWHDPDIWID